MVISRELAQAIIASNLHKPHTEKVNEIGGSVECIDFKGQSFVLNWLHSSSGKISSVMLGFESAQEIYLGECSGDIVYL